MFEQGDVSVGSPRALCCPPISTRWQLHVHEDVHNCTNCTLEKSEDFSLLQGNCPFVKRNVRSPTWEN